MTEPGAGSDVRGMQCFARRDGGDWVVNGTKHFISHADLADFVIVFVATGEEQTARGPKKRITCFLVDRGAPGFEILLVDLGARPADAIREVRRVRPGAIENAEQERHVEGCRPPDEGEPSRDVESIRDRALGAFIGLAAGDTVGTAPWKRWTPVAPLRKCSRTQSPAGRATGFSDREDISSSFGIQNTLNQAMDSRLRGNDRQLKSNASR